MAWDKMHRVVGGNGQVTMTPGYLTETITLGDDADASTSYLPVSLNSDATILAIFSRDITVDTYIQVEHSWDGVTYVKQGQFEIDASITGADISQDMSKIGYIDSDVVTETEGLMMLFDIDSHGAANYTRLTVKANGQDESRQTCIFYL